MRPSEEILNHIVQKHFESALAAGDVRLCLRAGDIHKELRYSSRMPAVCGVLGSLKLQATANARLVFREGPQQGANAVFHFEMKGKQRR